MKQILKAILEVLLYILISILFFAFILSAFTLFPYWLFSVLGGGM